MSGRIRSLNDFLALLKGVKRTHDGQHIALCPGHHDTKPSLSIKEADGKILLKCHADCDLVNILKPLGLKPADLFLNSHKTKPEYREITAIYHYIDNRGKPFEVVRTKPKGFYQRRPDGKGNYINNLRGIKPTLYRLDEVKKAIKDGAETFLVEGEKDVERLRGLGLIATTNPMGAGKWRAPYSEALHDADLVVIPDNDGPGYAHATKAAMLTHGKAKRIRMLMLPREYRDVSHYLDSGNTVEQLRQLANACPNYEPPAEAILPEVAITNRHLRDITADALAALYDSNHPERLFRRSGQLIRISVDEKRRPYTEILTEAAFRGNLARSANFIRLTAGGETVATSPPIDVVRDCMALGKWEFPPLLGITEAPVMRTDGTILTEPGYDHSTTLFYHPAPGLDIPNIPDEPTEQDIHAAIELAFDPISDFPFDSEASRANAIATMFTPILRPMIDGPVPLAIIDKPQPGTGASFLAEIISIIATGRPAAMMAAQKDDESWRKVVTSLLLKGQMVVTIDNIESTLWAPSLAAALTATYYQDRILGRSEMIILPNRVTWIATGNNIRLAGDLPRRCIWLRMDAKLARPWLRDISTFKHPRLIEWVSQNRGKLLAAILTLARGWVVAGKLQPPELPNLGGYESYCGVMGGVLAFIGIRGFLDNLSIMYDEVDRETPQWEGFLEVWRDTIGEEQVTAAALIGYLNDNEELRAALPDVIGDMGVRNYTRRLGNALAKRAGVRYPNRLRLVRGSIKHHAITWGVSSDEKPANSPLFSFKGELGESDITPARKRKTKKNGVNPYRPEGELNSLNSLTDTKRGELATHDASKTKPGEEKPLDHMPDYPTHPCHNCGCGDYWLTDRNQWLCSRCHPKPRGSSER